MRVGHDATAIRADRPQLALGQTGCGKNQPVPVHGPDRTRMVLAVLDAPELLARRRLVAIGRLGRGADEKRFALVLDHEGRRETLAEIAVADRFSLGGQVMKIDRAVRLPHGRAGPRIERDGVLVVRAVEMHDEQIAPHRWRRAGAAIVVARQIRALPKHLERLRVETRGARRTEGHVHATVLDHRRRRAVAVEAVGVLRRRDREEQLVE